MSGSILAGTAKHALASIDTHLQIEADLDPGVIREIVTQAEQMCFVMDAIERPHAVTRRSAFNGSPL
ncbi:MAG: hypothetical protein OEZ14_11730 [Acidimicrobiia bacterium]|nr:hypothetical protein [Acidimicrobiia bacterium]MDH5521188.1 hypothetical protein [Acidimicrobiia bacterium]